MYIYCHKRNYLHEKTRPAFHCFGKPICLPKYILRIFRVFSVCIGRNDLLFKLEVFDKLFIPANFSYSLLIKLFFLQSKCAAAMQIYSNKKKLFT